MTYTYDDYLTARYKSFFESPTVEELEEIQDKEENRLFDEWHDGDRGELAHELQCEFYDENYGIY